MEEQTTQQTQQEQEQATNVTVAEDVPAGEVESTEEPEIAIQDGEVKFSDKFFGDVKTEPESPKEQEPSRVTQTTGNTAPNYYTDEELQNIPYEQWDRARMPEDVKKYADILAKQQLIQRKMEEARKKPLPFSAPKQYTPKELNEEAMKLAVQKLGLESADDFDDYEGEHRAALDMARQELLARNNAEIANYQRMSGEYQNLQSFYAQLNAQPDFDDFHNWCLSEIQKNGNTPEQIEAGIRSVASQQGLGAVQQIWAEIYRQYKASKVQQKQPAQRSKVQAPAKLESTHIGYEGRKRVDMREFSQLDDDAQAKALIDMGIV